MSKSTSFHSTYYYCQQQQTFQFRFAQYKYSVIIRYCGTASFHVLPFNQRSRLFDIFFCSVHFLYIYIVFESHSFRNHRHTLTSITHTNTEYIDIDVFIFISGSVQFIREFFVAKFRQQD